MARKKTSENRTLAEIVDACLKEDPLMPGEIPGWIHSGCDLLDLAIGGEGYPMGRMVEVVGEFSSGKSLLALTAARSCLRQGGEVIYLDTESSIDRKWCRKIGIPDAGMLVRTPECMEEVHDIIRQVVQANHAKPSPTLIVWDSVAATASNAAVEKESAQERDPIGAEARLNSSFFRGRTLKIMRNSRIVLLVLNQVRDKIGAFGFGADTTTTPGGRAIGFYSTVRLHVKRADYMTHAAGTRPKGSHIQVETTKNKIHQPKIRVKFPLFFASGIDNRLACIRYLEEQDVLETYGNGRFRWKEKTYTRGELREHFVQDPDDYASLRALVRETFLREE